MNPGEKKLIGAFETLLVQDGNVCYLAEHYRRLCRGLKALEISVPWTLGELRRRVTTVVFSLGPCMDRAYRLRIMVWLARGQRHAEIEIFPYQPLTLQQQKAGVKVMLIKTDKIFNAGDGQFKTLDYALYRKATALAQAQGCFDGLLVGSDDRVIDGGRTSLVLLLDRTMVLGSTGWGTCAGVTRQRLAVLARQSGLVVRHRRIALEDLGRARNVWLTNALIGLVPCTCFGGDNKMVNFPVEQKRS